MTGMETQFFILGHLILIVLTGIFVVLSVRNDSPDLLTYRKIIGWSLFALLVLVEGIYWCLHYWFV